jgi:hypothetical protein
VRVFAGSRPVILAFLRFSAALEKNFCPIITET